MCYYQNVNNDITLDSFRPVLHWEKCGEILFFSKILCFLEKSLLSFREKSYFFEKNVISRKILFFLEKDKIFSWFFPVCTQPILWVILMYILLYDIEKQPVTACSPHVHSASHSDYSFLDYANKKTSYLLWKSLFLKK